MDTIFESIRRALKKVTLNPNQEITANPNQDVENVQDCSDDFITQELRKLTEIENGRPLKFSEKEREYTLV